MGRFIFYCMVFLLISASTVLSSKPHRIIYLLTCLEAEDWDGMIPAKWAQLRSLGDIWMMAFGRAGAIHSGTWATTINAVSGEKELQRMSDVCAFDTIAWSAYVTAHNEPNNTHLVVGTHGEGDYLYFNGVTTDGGKIVHGNATDGVTWPMPKFVDTISQHFFLSVTLDTCINGELYTASHFSLVTPLLVAAEGWMWSADRAIDESIFSLEAARALSDADLSPYDACVAMVSHYVGATDLADASVIRTAPASALIEYLLSTEPYFGYMTSALAGTKKHPRQFSEFCFYTVRSEVDTYDSQYLLDVQSMVRGDPAGMALLGETLLHHSGPRNYTAGDYNFQLTGLSITVVHI